MSKDSHPLSGLPHFQSVIAAEEELEREARESLRQTLGLIQVVCHRELVGGRSGSGVTRVFYQRAGESPALGVLKRTSRREDHERERDGHAWAASSWLSGQGWVPPTPHAVEDSAANHYLLLSPLAFPPGDGGLEVPSLHDLVESRQRSRAVEVVAALGRGYTEQFTLWTLPDEGTPPTAAVHTQELLRKWTSLRRYWDQANFASPVLLPASAVPVIQDLGGRLLWNPLWALAQPHRLPGAPLPLPRLFGHGDLNARNVLVSPRTEPSALVQMIDFEKAGVFLLGLDSCWLAFWLVMASQGTTVLGEEVLRQIPDALLAAVFDEPQVPEFLDAFQFGLDLARKLFEPWAQLPAERERALRPIGRCTLRLTLIAAATAKALLHDRDVERQGSQASNLPDSARPDGLWALVFFRVAALALERVLGRPAGGPVVSLQETFKKCLIC